MLKDLFTLIRLKKDRASPTFKTAPLWLVVMINDEIHRLKKKLNPFN